MPLSGCSSAFGSIGILNIIIAITFMRCLKSHCGMWPLRRTYLIKICASCFSSVFSGNCVTRGEPGPAFWNVKGGRSGYRACPVSFTLKGQLYTL